MSNMQERMATAKNEIEPVMTSLCEAWSRFIRLPSLHPDHIHDFRAHMNALQRLLGIRIARAAYPDMWSDPQYADVYAKDIQEVARDYPQSPKKSIYPSKKGKKK